jgi:hypothetical protein
MKPEQSYNNTSEIRRIRRGLKDKKDKVHPKTTHQNLLKKNLDCITPLKATEQTLPKQYWVFDSETSGLFGKPLIICAVSNSGERKEWVGDNCSREFIKWIYDNKRSLRGAWFFAHNLEFDMTKIFGQILKRRDFTVLMSGSRLITASLIAYRNKKSGKTKKITFVDTFNLCPTRLADIGESMGFNKGVTPQKFINGCEASDITQEDIDYCYRDCDVVMKFLDFYADILKDFDVKLHVTVASNAKAMWNRISLEKNLWIDKDNDERFRKAYYGGRVEVFISRIINESIYHYDINSQYPAVMLNNKFPNPSKMWHIENPTNIDYALKHYEGMLDVTVEAPADMHIPILPIRTTKLIFPVGTFRGSWCFPEIRYALKHGYKLIKVHSVTCSYPIKSPFHDYIEYFMDMKIKANDSEDFMRRELAKRFMNALSGKLGERREVIDTLYHTKSKLPPDYPYVMKGGIFQLRNVEKERARGTVVSWIAYITSYARVLLHSYMNDKTLYCDTDSIFTTEPLPDNQVHDSEFGLMALEHTLNRAYFIDPKKYAIEYGDTTKFVCKGVPKNVFDTYENIEDMDKSTLKFEYDKTCKLKTSLAKCVKPMSKEHLHKTLTRHSDPKRTYRKDGSSMPLDYTNI